VLTAGVLVVGSACAGSSGNAGQTPQEQNAEPAVPVSVELQVAEESFASEAIDAEAGGSITLEINGVTVTLGIPARALRTDLSVTMLGVVGIGHGESSFIGVNISPPIDVFPQGKEPTLTFTSLADSSFAVAWTTELTLESTDLARLDDGSWQITLQHFSGAGVGVGDDPVPPSRVDRALDDLYRNPPSASDDSKIAETLASLSKNHADTLRDASQRCHDLGPVREQVRIEKAEQFFGVEGSVDKNRGAMADVLLKSVECAREECANGDKAAAGRAAYALTFMEALGLHENENGVGAQHVSLKEDLVENGEWNSCLAHFIFVYSSSKSKLAGINQRSDYLLFDWFWAKGLVFGDGTTSWLPLEYQERGWDRPLGDFGSAFASALIYGVTGWDPGKNVAKCFIPWRLYSGQLETSLSFSARSRGSAGVPTLTFEVLLPPFIDGYCNDPEVLKDGWEPSALSVTTLTESPDLAFEGSGISYTFANDDECGLLCWMRTVVVKWGDPVLSGRTDLVLIVQAARYDVSQMGDENPRAGTRLVNPFSRLDLDE